MKITMHRKIIIFVTLLVVITVLALGSLNYLRTDNILNNITEREGYKTISDVNYSIDSFIKNMESNLQFVSANSAFSKLTPQNEQVMLKLFQDFLNENPSAIDIYLGTADKKMVDNQGSSLPAGYDPTSRDWYKQAVAADKLIWTEPYIDASTKNLVLTVAEPIKIENKVAGVLALDISLKTISEFVGKIKYGDSGYFIITDKNGVVIMSPDKNLLGKPLDVNELRNAILKNPKGSLKYSYINDKKFSVYKSMASNDWKIIGVISQREIDKDINQVIKYTIIFGLIIIILAVIVSNIITRSLIKNIKALVEDVKKIGSGDLTIKSKVKSSDEIGVFANVFNQMIDSLNSLIRSTKKASEEMTQISRDLESTAKETIISSTEIARTTTEISNVVSVQASETSDATIKVEELSKVMENVSGSINEAVKLCNKVQEINKNGLDVVNDLIVITDKSNISSQNVKLAIDEINESSYEINSIVETIRSIAEQTNLLALNASIEAARAGEFGRGFAVVAGEIKKLAEESTISTENIQKLIEKVKNQTNNAVIEMNNAKDITDKQTQSVNETGSSFKVIYGSIETLISNTNEIYNLNNNMISMKNKIVEVIESISAETEETSASTEQISASTEEQLATMEEVGRITDMLTEHTNMLNAEISRFKV